MNVGIYIEGQEGVTWYDWRQLARRTEALGFDALATSVHMRSLQAPGRWALDLWPVMTAIALWTKRIRFGPLVLPIGFYHPAQVARLSAGLDRLSGGRFRLSLGAGRGLREHAAFGLPFPEHDERVSMVGEAVEVIRRLWSGESVSFAGRWYRLEQAQVQPVPAHQWIGVGGNSEASLRVAAAQADEWCTAGFSGEELRQKAEQLDSLARQAGRQPEAVERTVMNGVLVGRREVELKRRALRLSTLMPELQGQAPDAILDRARQQFRWWVGTPEEVVGQVQRLLQTRLDHIFFQVFDYEDLGALNLLAQTVLPELRARPHAA